MTEEMSTGKFCTECGKQIHLKAEICPHCGVRQSLLGARAGSSVNTIPNYLVQAILVTLFCCLPFGIVSIVYAAQVNGKEQAGDLTGARQASRLAKKWVWIGFLSGFVFMLLYLGIMVFAAVLGG
jgi:predicted secreted protein